MAKQNELAEDGMSTARRNEIAFLLFIKMMVELIKEVPVDERSQRWEEVEEDMAKSDFWPYNISNEEIAPFFEGFREEVFAQVASESTAQAILNALNN